MALYISNDDIHCRMMWQQLSQSDVEQVCEIINVDQRQRYHIRRMMKLHQITHVPTMIYQGESIRGVKAILSWFKNLYDMCDEMKSSSAPSHPTTTNESLQTPSNPSMDPNDILENRLQNLSSFSSSSNTKAQKNDDMEILNRDNPFRIEAPAEDRKGNCDEVMEKLHNELAARQYEGI